MIDYENSIKTGETLLTAKIARIITKTQNREVDGLFKEEIDKEILEACKNGDYHIKYFSELEKGICGWERNIENIYKPLGFKVHFNWHGLFPGPRKKYCIISW